MPGSPPTTTAEPGTRPPPRTRSNSAMPVGRRGASRVSVPSPSKAAALPLPPLMATSAGGPEGAAASSMMLFHSPQAAHFPDQREVTAPQAWQTKAFEVLAIIQEGPQGSILRKLNRHARRKCRASTNFEQEKKTRTARQLGQGVRRHQRQSAVTTDGSITPSGSMISSTVWHGS